MNKKLRNITIDFTQEELEHLIHCMETHERCGGESSDGEIHKQTFEWLLITLRDQGYHSDSNS